MKILLINTFFHICGGAEAYYFNLAALLKKHGHEVVYFSMDHPKNYETEFSKYFVSYFPHFERLTLIGKIKFFFRIFFPLESRNKISKLLIEQKPDIVHIHQLSHEITHAVIPEIKKRNIPIVTTLHGYSYICPNAELFDGYRVCEACKDGKFNRMVSKNCIFGSKMKTFIMMMYSYLYFNILKVSKQIDLFIAPSKFLIQRYKKNKMFRDVNILHLPYCIKENIFLENSIGQDESIVYFGRLEKVKGVDIIVRAVKGLNINLKLIGTGAMKKKLHALVEKENINNVHFLGFIEHAKIKDEISKSLFSVVPSIYCDNYPNAIMESFALGKPVIASRLGGMPELVRDGETGYLFEAGNVGDLRERITTLLSNRELIVRMGKIAREWVKDNLDSENHYNVLIKEYERLIQPK